jgi:hyaluronate lyase
MSLPKSFLYFLLIWPMLSAADDFLIARDNWQTYLEGRLVLLADSEQALYVVNEDGTTTFTDISSHINDIYQLSSAFRQLSNANLKCSSINDSQLRDLITSLLSKYTNNKPNTGNWWHWEIAIPKQINTLLISLGQCLDLDIQQQLLSASRYHLPASDMQNAGKSSGKKGFKNTGANRVDTVLIVVQRSLIAKDEPALAEALSHLWQVLDYVEAGDGFYRDGGFVQHADIPYIGTYGKVLFEGFVEILAILKDTKWQPEPGVYALLVQRLTDHVIPFMAQGHMLDIVNGRGVARGNKQSAGHGADMIKVLKHLQLVVPEQLHNKVEKLIGRAEGPATTASSAYYPSIDRLVYHSGLYSAALAMHSNRIGNYECINGENLKGWFTADGMNYLYLHADDFIDVWPLLELNTPPGTTTNGKTPQLCSGRESYAGKKSAPNHVGGLVAGEVGVAVMDFYNRDNSVRMKKSWFYLPDKIVAIGSGGTGAVYTNVLQSFIDPAKVAAYSDIQGDNYFHYTDSDKETSLGVYLPYPQKWQRSFKQVSGAWSDINEQTPMDAVYNNVSKRRLTLNLLHDKDRQHYAYILLPNQTARRLQSFIVKPDVRILQQDVKAHAVYDEVSRSYMLNSFTRSEVKLTETLSVEGKVSVVIQHNGSEVEVSLSQPDRSGAAVTFTFGAVSADIAIRQPGERAVLQGNSVVVDTSGLSGAAYKFYVTL